MKPPEQQVEEDTAAYTGGYRGIVAYRLPTVQMMQTSTTISLIFLAGGRPDADRHGHDEAGHYFRRKTGRLVSQDVVDRLWHRFANSCLQRIRHAGQSMGHDVALSEWRTAKLRCQHFIAFGHIALVMLIVKSGAVKNLMDRFSAVGRMAFTNYLMHSIVMTTIFYGYGFGLYGQIPRLWQMAFVAAMLRFPTVAESGVAKAFQVRTGRMGLAFPFLLETAADATCDLTFRKNARKRV